MTSQIWKLASLFILPSILLASAETVTQCSSADNHTCEQECPWGEPPCNLSCQAESRFDACAQLCPNQMCDDLHCQYADNCTQSCVGQCDKLSCNSISNSCEQDCDGGKCSEVSCKNTQSCRQRCAKGKCDKLFCTNATECEQDCSSGSCRELNCAGNVTSCKQDGRQGKLTCQGESCDQACEDGSCSLSCSGEACEQYCLSGDECQMTCTANKCDQWCSGNPLLCRLTCSAGVKNCVQECHSEQGECYFYYEKNTHFRYVCNAPSCYVCQDNNCTPLLSGAVRVAVPGFTWIAGFLLFIWEIHRASLH